MEDWIYYLLLLLLMITTVTLFLLINYMKQFARMNKNLTVVISKVNEYLSWVLEEENEENDFKRAENLMSCNEEQSKYDEKQKKEAEELLGSVLKEIFS